MDNHHENPLRLGLGIFLVLGVLTGIEFAIAIFIQSVFLLLVLAVIKASLVAYYYMHISRLNVDDGDLDREGYAYKLGTNRFGLWMFLLSDSFLFGALLVARFNLLGMTRPELNQLLGLAVTSVLLISSFFMNRAETQMERGNRRGFLIGTFITILLGIGFLVGVVGVEWRLAPFGPADSVQGAIFFMMTGMHAFHVLTGVILLLVVFRNAWRGLYTPEKHWAVEAATVYWHFVDLVWIFFYPALYLVGHLLS